MLKPKGLSQDALIRLSCGGALEHFQLRRPAFPFSISFSKQHSCAAAASLTSQGLSLMMQTGLGSRLYWCWCRCQKFR